MAQKKTSSRKSKSSPKAAAKKKDSHLKAAPSPAPKAVARKPASGNQVPRAAESPNDWNQLREAPVQPKGPPKPWDGETTDAAEEFAQFLKDPRSKKELTDFIVNTYKRFEAEKVSQIQARFEHEREVDQQGAAPWHEGSNITPMLAKTLNMHDTERAFARGIKSTKASLTRSVDDRVEEITNLLAGIGGFSSQLKSCFARSTVVFLEQEDPNRSFRERLIFSINLPNYELKRPWVLEHHGEDEPAVEAKSPRGKRKPAPRSRRQAEPEEREDGRSHLQATWDDAVNSLAQIVASTGLKPKYVKNDRHFGRFLMKQDLRSSASLPDEYFSFTLDYNTEEKIQEMCGPYNRIVSDYEKRIEKLEKKLSSYPANSTSPRYKKLKKQHLDLVLERDYFVGTTPDPNQLDEGLLFLIEVSTLKDYHIVKDRMQSIMTKYILHLSKIAAQDAEFDADLEYEMWKMGQNGVKDPTHQPQAQGQGQGQGDAWVRGLTQDQIDSVPEYEIEMTQLRKKKAA